jgi:hypothetical protein
VNCRSEYGWKEEEWDEIGQVTHARDGALQGKQGHEQLGVVGKDRNLIGFGYLKIWYNWWLNLDIELEVLIHMLIVGT